MIDLLLISPGCKKLYQTLSDYSAIEPNIWAGMLGNSARLAGYSVELLDIDADRVTDDEAAHIVEYLNPRLILFVCTGQNPNASTAAMQGCIDLISVLRQNSNYTIAIVGPHVNAVPIETLDKHPEVNFVFTNEGVYALKNVLALDNFSPLNLSKVRGLAYRDGEKTIMNLAEKIVPQELLGQDLPGMDLSLYPDFSKYRTSTWHTNYNNDVVSPFASIYTSLGCIYKCLSGDTKVNTIYGDIPIKELSEKYTTIPVFTYNTETKDVCIADATNIRLVSKGERLVRVKFDDGTHIDCTPDHKFLTWQWGNQNQPTIEYSIEAKDLKPRQSVRAFKINQSKYGYRIVNWGRKKQQPEHRMLMEYKIGRKLDTKEQVHHIDGNKSHNSFENLQYCASQKEHFENHPEIAERMRQNNPQKYCTAESYEKIKAKTRGKKRSVEQRLRYSESKKGIKNPNFKDGHSTGQPSRVKETNHKVVEVIELEETQDVYCLTVKATGWFFANNVLVKNCSFCMINSINRTDSNLALSADSFNTFRYWEPTHIIKWFDEFAKRGIRNIKIADEMHVLKPKHCLELAKLIIERGYDFNIWCYTRISTIKEEYLPILKQAGISYLAVGIESGEQEIRKEITKGVFKDENIRDVIKMIRDHDINIGANYIFGLGHDTFETMKTTYDLMVEINAEYSNMYASMNLPGSRNYMEAKSRGDELPDSYAGYGFLSYECLPARTEALTAAEILKFRDEAYVKYNTGDRYLSLIEKKFGSVAAANIREQSKIKLLRKILGD